QYTAKLMVEGFLYKEIKYTYGQKSINLPAVPEKYGYTGKWEPYSLDIDGVTINAIYTKLPAKIKSVSVFDFDVNYKDTIKITPKIEADSNSNYTIKFKSSNNKIVTVDNNGNVYAAKKGNATITCTVTDEYGNQVSDTCNVTVGYTWWQWIIKIVLFGWIWY
ncbi:MAG: Ig-like domain-containing protein, partial [Ruminococcus sp.]|nr:Ig-like domain-containing protein [Candidatus Copronaster equi]